MEFVQVGYFSKTHGIKGQLILRLEKNFFVDEAKALLVESATGKAPFFISDIKENKAGLIIALEDINSLEKAKSLVGKKVFVEEKFIAAEDETPDLLGFELIDKTHGSLGNILEVSDNGHQVLVTVKLNNKEVILPLVEDFMESLDETNKKIFYNAPQGLIDLYL